MQDMYQESDLQDWSESTINKIIFFKIHIMHDMSQENLNYKDSLNDKNS